jgi:hypothetical protein
MHEEDERGRTGQVRVFCSGNRDMNNSVLLTLLIECAFTVGKLELALIGKLQTQSNITLKYLSFSIIVGSMLKHGNFTLQYVNGIVDKKNNSIRRPLILLKTFYYILKRSLCQVTEGLNLKKFHVYCLMFERKCVLNWFYSTFI